MDSLVLFKFSKAEAGAMIQRIGVAVVRQKLTSKQRGQAFLLATAGLVVLLGIGALAIDVGLLWSTRRQMQSAADAGAMAGADAIAISASSTNVTSSAQAASAQNGFTDGSTTTRSSKTVSVAVYNPPQSGTFATNSNAVEVKVSQVQPTYFMRVLNWSNVPVAADAIAVTVSGGSCVYALDPTASGTVTVTGTGSLTSQCGVYDNSNNSSALTVSGGGTIDAPLVGVVGGTTVNGGGSTPPTTGIAAFGDPLAWVPEPSVPSCSSYGTVNIGASQILNPGLYCGGLKLNAGANVMFNPGTYILNGGGLTVVGSATVSGSGVTFFLTGKNKSDSSPDSYGGANIASGATVNLSAPCSSGAGGIEGMLFFQDREITTGVGSTINGSSTSIFSGALYFPTTSLTYSGTSGSQYTLLVADQLKIAGTTSIGDNYSCLSNGSLIKNAALVQ
jgi:putative Tad-like protein involved in Flp pilus assembly